MPAVPVDPARLERAARKRMTAQAWAYVNVLRPTVAVARYVVFAALALHEHPQRRERLREADDEVVERFVQEVRRTTPFFPFVAARVREDFTWRGYDFARGRRVLLDLFGTNLDGRIWERPTEFPPRALRRLGR